MCVYLCVDVEYLVDSVECDSPFRHRVLPNPSPKLFLTVLIPDVGLEGYNTQAVAVHLAFVFKSFAKSHGAEALLLARDQSSTSWRV